MKNRCCAAQGIRWMKEFWPLNNYLCEIEVVGSYKCHTRIARRGKKEGLIGFETEKSTFVEADANVERLSIGRNIVELS